MVYYPVFFSFIAVEPTSFPPGPGFPVFVYIIIGVVILAVFLLFLCFLVFLSKHLYKRWQIQNAFKVSKPLWMCFTYQMYIWVVYWSIFRDLEFVMVFLCAGWFWKSGVGDGKDTWCARTLSFGDAQTLALGRWVGTASSKCCLGRGAGRGVLWEGAQRFCEGAYRQLKSDEELYMWDSGYQVFEKWGAIVKLAA